MYNGRRTRSARRVTVMMTDEVGRAPCFEGGFIQEPE
jgi:hypothetical protein